MAVPYVFLRLRVLIKCIIHYYCVKNNRIEYAMHTSVKSVLMKVQNLSSEIYLLHLMINIVVGAAN